MNLPGLLQRWLGFTRNEASVVFVLTAAFLAGVCIRWYQSVTSPEASAVPSFDYAESDTAFAERSAKTLTTPLTSPPQPAPPGTTSWVRRPKGTREVNLNSATMEELMSLPGIGPAYAERILQYRKEHGRFKSPGELRQVKGIGPKRFEKLRPYIITR